MSEFKQKTYADYTQACQNCGQSPCVVVTVENEQDYHFDMCGVCTFGEAICIDPDEWVTP